jgi:hypothetical protein
VEPLGSGIVLEYGLKSEPDSVEASLVQQPLVVVLLTQLVLVLAMVK